MPQYINKSTLVAEIEKLYDEAPTWDDSRHYVGKVLDIIDTLKTKELDLDKEARHYLLHKHLSPLSEVMHQADLKAEMQYHKDIENAFKAGFRLGISVSDKAQKGE